MFGALAQPVRLSIFRLLVEAGADGMNAGTIAERLGLPAATLSFHIAQLARAKLVAAKPEGRFIYYRANYPAMDSLIAFLTDKYCGGKACLPRTATASNARTPRKAA